MLWLGLLGSLSEAGQGRVTFAPTIFGRDIRFCHSPVRRGDAGPPFGEATNVECPRANIRWCAGGLWSGLFQKNPTHPCWVSARLLMRRKTWMKTTLSVCPGEGC